MQWRESLFRTAQPEVGKNWTDDGEIHEERGLKGPAADDTRVVPGHPSLTRILREHIKAKHLKRGNLPFRGEKGEMLAGSGHPAGHGGAPVRKPLPRTSSPRRMEAGEDLPELPETA